MLLRFWSEFAEKYRIWYALGVLCLVVTNGLTVAIPTFVQEAIDALDRGEGLEGTFGWALTILLAGLTIMVVRTLSRILFFNPGRTIEYSVKSKLFENLLSLPQSFFNRYPPGDIISRGTNDSNAMRALIGFASLQLFNVVFTLLLTLGRMFSMDLGLTLMCLCPLLIGGLIMRLAVILMFKLQAQLLAQLSTLSDTILENYTAVGLLQSYNALPGANARFDRENHRLLELSHDLLKIRAWLFPCTALCGQICVALILYVGGQKAIDGALTIGELSAFIAYVTILVSGLQGLGWLIGSTQRGYIALGRIYEALDEKAQRPPVRYEIPPRPNAGYGFSVRNLSFQYPGESTAALKDISFDIKPGETLGIFGPTGSGKSTLLSVLARIYEPDPNRISLAGRDICDFDIQAYWAAVAMVGQEPFLFSKTIAENIALASSPGKVDVDQVSEAAKRACLETDLSTFPEGLDTRVGERGITLSGGQRQRTALARAFHRDFDVLLLDDVMSAVDHATEQRLIKAIYEKTRGVTTVVVSHRISVLTQAERILVLDEGELIDEGHHAELLERCNVYAEAWRIQSAAEAFAEVEESQYE